MNIKQLSHKLTTGLKFIYPCINWVESVENGEMLIISTTNLDRLYAPTPIVEGMEYVGEDFFSRELFKNEKGLYFVNVDGTLYFKGADPEGEPDYSLNKKIRYEFQEIDPEISKFNPYIEKIKSYIEEYQEVTLKNIEKELSNEYDPNQKQIVCKIYLKFKGIDE